MRDIYLSKLLSEEQFTFWRPVFFGERDRETPLQELYYTYALIIGLSYNFPTTMTEYEIVLSTISIIGEDWMTKHAARISDNMYLDVENTTIYSYLDNLMPNENWNARIKQNYLATKKDNRFLYAYHRLNNLLKLCKHLMT